MTKEKIKQILVNNSLSWNKKESQDIAEIYVDDFLKELLEAITVTPCCTELKDKGVMTFDEWCSKYVKAQGENVYLYNMTSYTLFELMMVYKKIKELNL